MKTVGVLGLSPSAAGPAAGRADSPEPRAGLCAPAAAFVRPKPVRPAGRPPLHGSTPPRAVPGPLSPAAKEFRKSNLFPDYRRGAPLCGEVSLTVAIPAKSVEAFKKSRRLPARAQRPADSRPPWELAAAQSSLSKDANEPQGMGFSRVLPANRDKSIGILSSDGVFPFPPA